MSSNRPRRRAGVPREHWGPVCETTVKASERGCTDCLSCPEFRDMGELLTGDSAWRTGISGAQEVRCSVFDANAD
jgi:hypothetical protein